MTGVNSPASIISLKPRTRARSYFGGMGNTTVFPRNHGVMSARIGFCAQGPRSDET